MPQKINTIMIEDHPEYRDGISLALETEPDVVLTNQFGMAEQALRFLENNTNTDVVLLDLNLPEMSGLEAIPWIKKYCPSAKIIVLSQSENEQDILNAIHRGAAGYLLKESTLDEIVSGIRAVVRGEATLDSRIAKFIFRTIQTEVPKDDDSVRLSQREIQILKLLSEGLMKKDISKQLNIGITTVSTHVRRIYEKLESPNAPAAVAKAYKTGIFKSSDAG